MAKRDKLLLLIAVVVVLGVGAGVLRYFSTPEPPPASPVKLPEKKNVKKAFASDEERRKYIEDFVVVHDLRIDPDTKPQEDGGPVEVVPGLLKVHGVVENTGDRDVGEIKLVVFTKTETKEVLGTYIQDIAGKLGLKAGQRRTFKFEIPDKKAFKGDFAHKLR